MKSKGFDFTVILIVWASFFVYGAIAAPVPAVNEPHYLIKARHFWQPEWCSKDFFLESSNAHTVFFATVGSLTQWLTLEQTAWVGRLLATAVLSIGWCGLTSALSDRRWFPLHAGWMFLSLQSCGNFSGEWLVGGVEGKVFSYGLLFASLGLILRDCGIEPWLVAKNSSILETSSGLVVRSGSRTFPTILAGAMAGMAIAVHPVVGVWGVLAFLGAEFFGFLCRKLGFEQTDAVASESIDPTPVVSKLVVSLAAVIAMIVCAIPGLIPVVRLLSEPLSADTKFAANFIQVYYRLAHHLDPMQFPSRAYIGYSVLVAVWQVTVLTTRQRRAIRLFNCWVGFAILFALAGIVVGFGPRPAALMPYFAERAQLLKFYPFRLADVLVPVAVSIGVVGMLQRWGSDWLRSGAYGLLFVSALCRAHSIVEVNRYSGETRADWIDVCRWIDVHLPSDVVVQAPHNGWAFKWFAHRAEYVAFKDCPQNGEGIVEWNRRLLFLKKWYEKHYSDEFYSADELHELSGETGITHLLTDRLGPLGIQPIYRNGTFQVYDLRSHNN